MSDLIERQAAICALGEEPEVWSGNDEYEQGLNNQWHYDVNALKALPIVEAIPIEWLESTLTQMIFSGKLKSSDAAVVYTLIHEWRKKRMQFTRIKSYYPNGRKENEG